MADTGTPTLSRTEVPPSHAAFGVAVDGVEHRPSIDFIGPGMVPQLSPRLRANSRFAYIAEE